ncbi:MAG: hypothetical protein QXJ17_01000 [Nitrososphaeria archaeon]
MNIKNHWSFGVGKVFVIFVAVLIIAAAFSGFTWYYYKPSTTTTSPVPFSMNVVPRPLKPSSIEESHRGMLGIVGQKCMFLVSIIEKSYGSFGPINISASSEEGMADVQVTPQQVHGGQVAEVIIVPKPESIGSNLTIMITGERNGLIQKEMVFVQVIDWKDSIGSTAEEIRDKFIPWITVNYPELGILNATEWEGTIVNPRILVVMHYIFLSEEWEMYVTWHVMTPPNDWAKIYLRHRFNETRPSYAFEIPSIEGGTEPHPIELPDWI